MFEKVHHKIVLRNCAKKLFGKSAPKNFTKVPQKCTSEKNAKMFEKVCKKFEQKCAKKLFDKSVQKMFGKVCQNA